MKQKTISAAGKFLMKLSPIKICIIDDEEAYFNKSMLETAKNSGFKKIDRHYKIDHKLFTSLQQSPYDILILDVQGIVDPTVAKDGLYVASTLTRTTNSYIAITSAHQFHLTNKITEVDYIIEQRLLTAVDFLDILIHMTDDYLERKAKPYKNLIFKLGFSLAKKSLG
jgi:hypothetical protein